MTELFVAKLGDFKDGDRRIVQSPKGEIGVFHHGGAFYAYAYPQPDGYDTADLGVEGASFDTGLGEFVLPYRTVRTSDDPDGLLRRFLDATAAAAADLAAWPEQPVRPPKHL